MPQGVLIFLFKRRLGPFFMVQNFKLKKIVGVGGLWSEKYVFWGDEEIVNIFCRSLQNWTIDIFGVCLNP